MRNKGGELVSKWGQYATRCRHQREAFRYDAPTPEQEASGILKNGPAWYGAAPPIDLARKTVIYLSSGGLGERNIHRH